MRVTFEMVSEDLKKKILEKGIWSLGKGKFELAQMMNKIESGYKDKKKGVSVGNKE